MDEAKQCAQELPALLVTERRCRTKDVGLEGFSGCMVARPNHCRYAVLFGNEVFCSHPKHTSYRKTEPELS